METLVKKLKKIPVFQAIYKVPGVKNIYHFFWAWSSALIYGFPSRRLFVIGITGTKGKTTSVELVNAVLEAAGKKTALLSSVRRKVADISQKNYTGNSMPGRGAIQKFLRDAVRAHCEYAVVEVTSEGAKFFRHLDIAWKAGVLTNLSPEHIESHGSFEKYRAAKLSFLRYVGERGGTLFINSEDENAPFFLEELKRFSPLTYSSVDAPQLSQSAHHSPQGLLQRFNQANQAVAASVARRLGIPDEVIVQALEDFIGVPGRMEFVQILPFAVIVDYAHTPDSLEKVYQSMKEYIGPDHKLIGVLGSCGGGRDKWKRPKMGEVAARYCNEVILTNEDPYDEDPMKILEQIAEGFPKNTEGEFAVRPPEYIIDRREAIAAALSRAAPGDAVVMTGKGSESSIHIQKGQTIPWDEKVMAREVLQQVVVA